jgi:hypothetical protein
MNRVFPFRKRCWTSASMIRRKEGPMTGKSRLAALATSISEGMADAMHARAMQLTAATLVAVALLAGTAAAAKKSEGLRPFNAGNALGDAQGYIGWNRSAIALQGQMRDFQSSAKSSTALFVSSYDDRPKQQREQVVVVPNGKGIQIPQKFIRTQGTPRKALVSVCSRDEEKKAWKDKWKCGRPG